MCMPPEWRRRLKEGESWNAMALRGEVKMWIGHEGPRTEEKWRMSGMSFSRGRVSRITATLSLGVAWA